VDEVSDDPAAAVAEADLVVLAVPVGAMRSVAETIVTRLRPGTVVMDVGSVKAVLVEQLEPLFRRAGCRFVGSHPIAGKEGGGPAEADPHLFHDRRCILTPTVRTDPGALSRLRALWQGIGMQVEDLDPVTHDRILARVSHVPHLVAYALAAAVGEAQVPGGPVADYAGSGFRDTTRIAASSAELWRDIALANRAEVLAGLEEFRGHLKTLGEIIERGDGAALERALDVARRHRRNLGPG
jgi:prephenate dehydrogenase